MRRRSQLQASRPHLLRRPNNLTPIGIRRPGLGPSESLKVVQIARSSPSQTKAPTRSQNVHQERTGSDQWPITQVAVAVHNSQARSLRSSQQHPNRDRQSSQAKASTPATSASPASPLKVGSAEPAKYLFHRNWCLKAQSKTPAPLTLLDPNCINPTGQ
jgi:hypothetical protein